MGRVSRSNNCSPARYFRLQPLGLPSSFSKMAQNSHGLPSVSVSVKCSSVPSSVRPCVPSAVPVRIPFHPSYSTLMQQLPSGRKVIQRMPFAASSPAR